MNTIRVLLRWQIGTTVPRPAVNGVAAVDAIGGIEPSVRAITAAAIARPDRGRGTRIVAAAGVGLTAPVHADRRRGAGAVIGASLHAGASDAVGRGSRAGVAAAPAIGGVGLQIDAGSAAVRVRKAAVAREVATAADAELQPVGR